MEYERFESAVLILHEHTPRLVVGERRVRCIDQGSDVFLLESCISIHPSKGVTIIKGAMHQYKLFFGGHF